MLVHKSKDWFEIYTNPNVNPNTRDDENTNMMMMIKHIVARRTLMIRC